MEVVLPNTLLPEVRQAKRLRRKPIPESELPPEAQEMRRQFREWDESFATPAKRMAYIKALCQRIAEAFHPEKIVLFGSHAMASLRRNRMWICWS